MLRDEMRTAVRIMSTLTDSEIDAHISAAIADMRRAGVRDELLDPKTMDGLVKEAVMTYCKANYGPDGSLGTEWLERYKWNLISILNSAMNECDEGEDDGRQMG